MDSLLFMCVVLAIARGAQAAGSALIIVDVQDCFTRDGSLAVPEGDSVVPVINRIRKEHAWKTVVVSQDWHCPRHISFASSHKGLHSFDSVELKYLKNGTLCLGPSFDASDFPHARQCKRADFTLQQGLWPDHCVEGYINGKVSSALVNELATEDSDVIIKKGNNCDIDSYSVFYDNGQLRSTGLHAKLQAAAVTHVFVTGLALDYCVYFTALDAKRLGYETFTVLDAARGVAEDTTAAAKRDMMDKGIHLIDSSEIGASMYNYASDGNTMTAHRLNIIFIFLAPFITSFI